MKLLIGVVIGIGYGILVVLAFMTSQGAWQAGSSDLGFWWAVIGCILAVAGSGAVVGSWLHTRQAED